MLKSLAVVAALAAGATAQQSLNINTVFASQCLPTMLTWGGGTPPYWVTIIQGGSATNPVLQNVVGPTSETSVTWIANIGAGTNIAYSIRDNTGAMASSGSFNVATGNTDCMTGNPNSALTADQSGSTEAPSVTGSPTGGAPASSTDDTGATGGAGGATGSAGSAAASGTDAAGSAVSSGTEAAGSAVSSATASGTGAATSATSAPATTSGTASGSAAPSGTGNSTAYTNSASFGAVVVAVIGAAVAAF